jgi:hypothetical protein
MGITTKLQELSLASLHEGQNVIKSANLFGFFKGIVEDVCDPLQLGRVKVRVFSVHGYSTNLPTENLPWAEPAYSHKGSFSPPEIFDRVWVTFENGDRYKPIYFGHWNAHNDDVGGDPWEKKIGSTTPPETRYSSPLYPEGLSVARSGEGNQIWFLDHKLDDKDYFGELNIQDSSGRYIKFYNRKEGKIDGRFKGDEDNPDPLDDWEMPEEHRTRDLSERHSEITPQGGMSIGTKNYELNVNESEDTTLYLSDVSSEDVYFDQMSYNGQVNMIISGSYEDLTECSYIMMKKNDIIIKTGAGGSSSFGSDLSSPQRQGKVGGPFSPLDPAGSCKPLPEDADIGALSRRQESGGDPGIVAKDTGGAAYGLYQMNSGQGTPQRFVKYLEKTDPEMAKELKANLGDEKNENGKFAKAWKNTSDKYGDRFAQAQKDFAKKEYYDSVVNDKSIKQAGGQQQYSSRVDQAIMSTSIQHGQGGARSILNKAGYG